MRSFLHAYRPRFEALEDRTLMSTCTVTRLFDTIGARGTLRYCVNFATLHPGPDEIVFAKQGTITLQSALPDLQGELNIIGPGENLLTVEGGNGRTFTVASEATVSISDMTITKGFPNIFEIGGNIRNDGTLTLVRCTVSDNRYVVDYDVAGGGIGNTGRLVLNYVTVSGNTATDTSFFAKGGGIYNTPSGEAQIFNSTIHGNTVVATDHSNFADGGGIHNAGKLELINSTVSGNVADVKYTFSGTGGGIYNKGNLDIISSTITQNSSDGTLGGVVGNIALLRNTIIAGNKGTDLSGSYTGDHNLIGGNPLLGPLGDNGGPTLTHALLPGSPAIDAGDNTDAPEWDQRGPGYPRIVNGRIDIGSFEVQATGAPGTTDNLAVLITADMDDSKLKSRRIR